MSFIQTLIKKLTGKKTYDGTGKRYTGQWNSLRMFRSSRGSSTKKYACGAQRRGQHYDGPTKIYKSKHTIKVGKLVRRVWQRAVIRAELSIARKRQQLIADKEKEVRA